MIRLSCGLVTVIKPRGDDVPKQCGEDLEDLRVHRRGLYGETVDATYSCFGEVRVMGVTL